MTVRRGSWRSALCLTALLALSWPGAPTATAASRWLEISSADFVMVTDLPEKRARSLLRDFEVFQFAVSRIIAQAETRPRTPTYLLALSASDFSAMVELKNAIGAFHGGQFANYVLYEQTRNDQLAREVVFHEYMHFVLHNNPGVIYPAWYNEGLAEVFSTLTERNGAIQLGDIPKGRAYTVASLGLMPTERLLEIDYRSADFRAHRLIPQFYAQSWLMTHYLMIGNDERARQLGTFITKLSGGASNAEAMQAAFGIDTHQLHSEVQRYVRSGKLKAFRIRFKEPLPTAQNAPLRVLNDADAQAFLGLAALRTNKDGQRAWRFFDRALKEDASNPLACAGAAIVKDAQGKTDEATALLERALTHPDATRAQLLAADLLLARAARALKEKPDDTEGRASALRARERYQSLLGDAVANNEAAYGYARAAMLLKDPQAKDVLAVVRPAAARLPTSTNLAYVEAVLSLAVGDLAMASTAATRAARFATSFEERKNMLAMLENIEKRIGDSATQKAGQ